MDAPMKKYDLVPGPTKVLPSVSEAYSINFTSPDIDDEFFQLYDRVTKQIGSLVQTDSWAAVPVVIMSGEGMLALWAALKSCLVKGDKVLCIATGIFGHGVAEMAKQIGAEVEKFTLESNEAFTREHIKAFEDHVIRFQPKMITMIHCETPSGTLNPLEEVGWISHRQACLFYVDMVASAFGVPLAVGNSYIDLGLIGSQKCLSLPPDLSILTVSDRAWGHIETVDYCGYDALKPWKTALQKKYFPYTHNWRAITALERSLNLIEQETLENVIQRHADVSAFCIQKVQSMGLEIFPKDGYYCSPTVTAVKVPANWDWKELNEKLKARGVLLGGNYGDLAGKVFRIGHMGTQADIELVRGALDILAEILAEKK